MVSHQPNLEQLQQALRIEICSTCPFRTKCIEGAGIRRTCEKKCPLFVHLPVLKDRAERLDPMIGRHEQALLAWMNEMVETDEAKRGDPNWRARNPLRRHRRRAARILARFTNP